MPHKGKPAAAAVVHAHLDAKGLVQETIAWDVRLSLNDCVSAGLKCYKKVFPLLLCKNTTELFQSAKAPQGLKVLAVQGHVRAAHFEQLRAPCCHLGLGRFLFGFGPREQLIHRRHHVGHSPADLGQRQRKIMPPTKATPTTSSTRPRAHSGQSALSSACALGALAVGKHLKPGGCNRPVNTQSRSHAAKGVQP